MTTATPGMRPGTGTPPPVSAGSWRVDPVRSHALFTARVAGGSVRGRVPLTGNVLTAQPVEGSSARLTAMTRSLSTGSTVLDRLVTGPGFLDADVFPEVGFRTDLLACVPAGWRAVGRLQVKGTDHALACELDLVGPRPGAAGPSRVIVTSRWVLDSRWITSQWIPGLSRRIVMTCAVTLDPVS